MIAHPACRIYGPTRLNRFFRLIVARKPNTECILFCKGLNVDEIPGRCLLYWVYANNKVDEQTINGDRREFGRKSGARETMLRSPLSFTGCPARRLR